MTQALHRTRLVIGCAGVTIFELRQAEDARHPFRPIRLRSTISKLMIRVISWRAAAGPKSQGKPVLSISRIKNHHHRSGKSQKARRLNSWPQVSFHRRCRNRSGRPRATPQLTIANSMPILELQFPPHHSPSMKLIKELKSIRRHDRRIARNPCQRTRKLSSHHGRVAQVHKATRVCHGRSPFHVAGAPGPHRISVSHRQHRLKALTFLALARAMLADTGMTTAREDLAL